MIDPHIDIQIKAQIQPDKPGAAVAVIHEGTVIHQAGYGLANIEWNIPITTDTVFKIASITKTFSATAIMMLVEQGKIALNASITDYLPDYHTAGHHVTVQHLLNHTSGIHNFTDPLPGEDLLAKLRRSVTPSQMLAEFSRIPFEFKPGSQSCYSNSNYVLLGQIIEKVSGQTYEEFLQAHILNPLAMDQTCFLNDNSIIPRFASGYLKKGNGMLPAPYLSMSWAYSAGDMASTVKDLLLWDTAVSESALLKTDSQEKMHTPLPLEDGSLHSRGYGWSVTQYEGHRAFYHSGGIPGYASILLRLPDEHLSIVILSNYDGGIDPCHLSTTIIRQILDLPEIRHRPYIMGGNAITRYIGQYALIQITAEEGKFFFVSEHPFTGAIKTRIMPISSTQFYNTDYPEELLTFTDEQDGVFTTLLVKTPLKEELTYKRKPVYRVKAAIDDR